MKLSTKGRYGLRALVDLAVNSREEAVCIQSIADRQNISESYLEQLMRLLRKAGLVQSVRGAGGGYRLAKPAESISVGDILRALEGDLEAVNCKAFQKEHPCEGADICVTKYVWKRSMTRSARRWIRSCSASWRKKAGGCRTAMAGPLRMCAESRKGEEI